LCTRRLSGLVLLLCHWTPIAYRRRACSGALLPGKRITAGHRIGPGMAERLNPILPAMACTWLASQSLRPASDFGMGQPARQAVRAIPGFQAVYGGRKVLSACPIQFIPSRNTWG